MRAVVAFCVLLIAVTSCGMAYAQPAPCAPKEAVFARLATGYGEGPAVTAMMPDALLEIWMSPETGTWTAIAILPQGLACIVASGTDFHLRPVVPRAKGAPT